MGSTSRNGAKKNEDMINSEDVMNSSLKILTNMAKRPEIDIEFRNLTYTIRSGFSLNKKKNILDDISGAFHTGQLTGILGPSGSGKSSLMNILADYSSVGVTGDIDINGRPRNKHLFRKLSCYIMQDDLIQSGITVEEAMNIAANLKLGSELKQDEKFLVIEEILVTLGLTKSRSTRAEKLSGGQRKRLSVALELVNNPPIIILDEPSSGLDTVSTQQLIKLLKHLAHTGRTVICTIHQPPASIFSLFDHVYFLSKGKCVYQGNPKLLVPFMTKLNFHCPVTHNPADFILEILHINLENMKIFVNAIKNGQKSECIGDIIIKNDKQIKPSQMNIEDVLPPTVTKDMNLPTTLVTQFVILYKRMLLQKRRNLTSLWILIAHHVISGLLVGAIFYDIGNDGSIPIANFKFCLSVVVFFMYTYTMSPILLFPTEFQILRREHFNRWYGLKAYFLAMTFSSIPSIIILGVEFIFVTYWMSGQIMDLKRFALFSIASILTALCSEGFGLAIGTIFAVRNGSIIGPGTIAPLLALSVYGMGFGPNIETIMYVLMRLSFIRYGIVGLCIALYDQRDKMNCINEPYCHYGDYRIFFRDMGMSNTTYLFEILGLLGFTILHRIVAYLALHFRLQEEFSDRIRKYLILILRNK
ncbi:ATP-binding cassette subfamily G member 4-like [Arctopsyche grandis]|uniref:ATP-binding cassette subfamily G member 4-like n=1 Tax=Arctopsyche grandis TaxID=121162 RepID=UPI00406D9836